MNTSLTIRLTDDQRLKLHELAATLGKSDSELVRDLIAREICIEPLGARIAHLKGSLTAPSESEDSLTRTIRERNWRK